MPHKGLENSIGQSILPLTFVLAHVVASTPPQKAMPKERDGALAQDMV